MPGPNETTPQQLMKRLGTAKSPVVIDLRTPEDYDDDPRRVPSAVRASFTDIDRLSEISQGAQSIIYCQKGRKISHGAAALLRGRGFDAKVLEGGQVAWVEAGLPVVSGMSDTEQQTRWVTRHRPKIDRIACPWLIKRFIDPRAEILFVPPVDVELVAEKFDCTPFDIEGVDLSHSGQHCSFDRFLERFGLNSEALATMARVVRAADTDNLSQVPEAAGLLALCLGLSRLHKNDAEQLEDGMVLFDALYLWARDAQNETHDWPNPSGKSGGVGQ